MKILGIDTSTFNCSVGLVDNGTIIKEKAVVGKSIHSEKLMDLVGELFESREEFESIDSIAVSIGPGSYTGLRIGLSTAKGLALPKDLSILPVPTLNVLSLVARDEFEGPLLLFVKSHQDFVYFRAIDGVEDMYNISYEILYDRFENAVSKYPSFNRIVGDSDFTVPENRELYTRYPTGGRAAQLAFHNYKKLLRDSTDQLEPFYFTEMKVKKWKLKKD